MPRPRLALLRCRRQSLLAAVAVLGWMQVGATPLEAADRWEQEISEAAPEQRSRLLLQVAERFEATDPGRALALAKEAEALARDPRDRLAALALQALLHRQHTDYSQALAIATTGLQQAAALGDDRLRARFFYVLARTQWSYADYPSAVANFHEAIRLGEKTQDTALLCDAHTGIITIHTEFGDHSQAGFHVERAGRYAAELRDPRRLGDYHKVRGNHLDHLGDRAGARAAHEQSLQVHEAAGNERGVADALQNVGYTIEADGDLAGAERCFRRAIEIYERLDLRRHLANATRQLGRVLVNQGRVAEGLASLERSLALARSFGGSVAIAHACRVLAAAHEKAGNLPLALDYQRKLEETNNAIFSEKTKQQIAVLGASFEVERRRHEVDLLRRDQALKDAELARVRWQRYALGALLGLGLVAVGALASWHRLRLAAERRIRRESEAARAAAEAADEFKTRLLGIASHDLKSPLRGMIAGADELALRPAEAERTAELGQRIGAEGRRMSALIRDLLDYAALEAGRLELVQEEVDLPGLLAGAVEAFGPRAREKQIELRYEGSAAGPLRVTGDAARLRQVFDNLIDNALKFSPPGRTVTVAVAREAEMVRVEVRDEGPGFQAQDFARVFQPFRSLSATPTSGEPSSGLGLFIAQELVGLHRGRLGVDSLPGRGSTLLVELPLRA